MIRSISSRNVISAFQKIKWYSVAGIEVEASSDIMVHAANVNELSSDAFLVLPIKALGTDYFIMSYIYTGIRQYGYTQVRIQFS